MNGAEIVFDGLAKYYGSSTALEDFSLEVRPGEFMTLLGPSGSGKTTALNCLAGFIDPDRGELRVAGKNILDLSPERRQLGMVFQSYTLFPHMSVYDNVAFPLRLRKMRSADIRKKVDAVLDMVQLSAFASRMPSALSGGQQQRVAFARAVVFEPPVLLMDEPLSALDLKLRKAMQLEIKQYHAELGCTIIFVTHDQEEALVLSDRVAIMSDGMIRQVDTPDQIYDRPNSRYVAEFIGKTNLFTLRQADGGGREIVEIGSPVDLHLQENEPVNYLSVRPEKIRRVGIDEGPGTGSQRISFVGTVAETMFLGNMIQYDVRVAGSAVVVMQEHRSSTLPELTTGQSVQLAFNLSDALPLAC
ncbi:MAG TPA: ABC transporter ATP-binding protein [Burkholderiaceae bacterium]|nr:ABC transporter ATP-binding protein [Burkholderiaceae bacterium]